MVCVQVGICEQALMSSLAADCLVYVLCNVGMFMCAEIVFGEWNQSGHPISTIIKSVVALYTKCLKPN